MPILPAEPDLFPHTLLDEPADGRLWLVTHTKPRQEKTLARWLHAAGLPFYLPCGERVGRVRGRAVTSHVPVFGGYLFLRLAEGERLHGPALNPVVRLLPVPDQERLTSDLRQVRHLLASGLPVAPEEQLEPGDPVVIRSGPLAGMRGTLVQVAGGCKVLVSVDFIQKGLSVAVDRDSVVRDNGLNSKLLAT
jgi:transcriptional antiterminator RfaH